MAKQKTIRRPTRTRQQQRDRETLAEVTIKAIASAPSSAWEQELRMRVNTWPIPGHPGMILGRAKVLTTRDMVSNNKGEQGVRRWTPPNNISLEDMLDEMSIGEAQRYYHPSAILYAARQEAHYDPCPSSRLDPRELIVRCVRIVPWQPNLRGRGRATVVCRDGTSRARWPSDRCETFPDDPEYEQMLLA